MISFRVFLVFCSVAVKKRLFYVRHGESQWNEAVTEHDIKAMLGEVDHPLTKAGVTQAQELNAKW